MVVSIHFKPTGTVYTLACGEKHGEHYEIEITSKKIERDGAGFVK